MLDQSFKHIMVFSATAKWEQPHAIQLDLLGIFYWVIKWDFCLITFENMNKQCNE